MRCRESSFQSIKEQERVRRLKMEPNWQEGERELKRELGRDRGRFSDKVNLRCERDSLAHETWREKAHFSFLLTTAGPKQSFLLTVHLSELVLFPHLTSVLKLLLSSFQWFVSSFYCLDKNMGRPRNSGQRENDKCWRGSRTFSWSPSNVRWDQLPG